jgi:uncharacterized protein
MNGDARSARRWVVLLGIAVEGGLVLTALPTGWMLGQDALATFRWSATDALWGVLATIPPLVVFLLCLRSPIEGLQRIRRFCEDVLRPALASCSFAELLLISVLAGLGEEMLFRGVLQPVCAAWLGNPWLGLATASLLFGLAHAVTFTYVVYAALMGAYLGWVWLATRNLLTVIVIHSLYDLGALLYLLYATDSPRKKKEEEEAPDEPDHAVPPEAPSSLPESSNSVETDHRPAQ